MQELDLSKRQYEALEAFYSGDYDEILYGGGARGGKSFIIGVLMAIGVAAMPGSSWLISRTVLSELHSTTLSTFYTVLKQFGFGPKSYKDKIRDKKRIEFLNGSMVYVIQVGWEPSDPEFDRLGSHSFTGSFLDEAQQMVTKIRSVLTGRYSETSADFHFDTDYKEGMTPDFSTLGYSLKINIIGQAEFVKDDLKGDFIKKKKSGKYWLGIVDEKTLFIPYKVVSTEVVGKKLRIQAVWNFTACSLLSCNPGKNFTYTDFWKPFAKGELPANRKFIRALVTDNPFVEKDYIKRLERSDDEITKQRLLYGNFEYDDDPTLLFDSNSVYDMFKGPALDGSKVKYMTVDAARMGKDMTVAYIWEGFNIIDIKVIKDGYKLSVQADELNRYINKYNIDLDNIIVDEVGVGGGLVDMIGCKGFIANSTPLQPISRKLLEYKRRNYQNLRTQCFFYLQRYIKEGKIKILNFDTSIKETISEELLFIKQDKIDDDKKICLQSKKEMKELLGRSPDYADCFIGKTSILTDKGNKNIEDIKVGDYVITPFGTRKVNKVFHRKEYKNLFLLKGKLLGTGNHKIYTTKGFKKLDTITFIDNIETYYLLNLLKWRLKRLLNIMVRNIGFREQVNIITGTNMNEVKKLREHYIETYGKNIIEKYKNDTTYTILIEMFSIIKLKILIWLNDESIYHTIGKKKGRIKSFMINVLNNFKILTIWQKNGINQKNEIIGIKNIIKKVYYWLKRLKKNVKIVENNIKTQEQVNDFVEVYVHKDMQEKKKDIMKKEPVLFVENDLKLINTGKQKLVQEVVVQNIDGVSVYDIEVEGDNCYYANGFLVSNCLSFRLYWVVKGIAERGYEESEIIEDEEGNDVSKVIEEWDKKMNEKKEDFDLDIYE